MEAEHSPGTLRRFQADLNAHARQGSSRGWLAMEVGNEGWLVDLTHTEEALLSPPIAAIGSMPSGLMGIAAARSKVYTVLDMPGVLTQSKSRSEEAGGWLVAVSPEYLPGPGLALWWPRLLGVMPAEQFEAVSLGHPPLASATYQDSDGRVWYVLDLPSVVEQVSRFVGANSSMAEAP